MIGIPHYCLPPPIFIFMSAAAWIILSLVFVSALLVVKSGNWHFISTILAPSSQWHVSSIMGEKVIFTYCTLKASDISISLCWLNFLGPDLCSSKTKWCVIHRPNSYLARGCHFHCLQQLQTPNQWRWSQIWKGCANCSDPFYSQSLLFVSPFFKRECQFFFRNP